MLRFSHYISRRVPPHVIHFRARVCTYLPIYLPVRTVGFRMGLSIHQEINEWMADDLLLPAEWR